MEDIDKTEKEEVKDEMVTLGPEVIGKHHYFELKRDNDGQMVAQCRDCPMGYPIATEEVRDGHIYIHNNLVI